MELIMVRNFGDENFIEEKKSEDDVKSVMFFRYGLKD
jgi:hypothetical protein